jgi:hypothetical protein
LTDLSFTIAPKSDQLNSDDLIAGPRTITIRKVTADPASPEQPVAIFYDGDDGKPYKPCKSMRRVMIAAWGTDGAAYVGRSMTLYRDPAVMFGGMQVGGIRISHMTHIDRDLTLALTVTKAKRAGFTVRKLAAPKPAETAPAQASPPADALAAARNGTDHFRAWWAASSPDTRAAAKPHMPALQAICAEADSRDVFGLPPASDRTGAPATDAEIESQVLAELAARDSAAEGRVS